LSALNAAATVSKARTEASVYLSLGRFVGASDTGPKMYDIRVLLSF